MGDEATVKGIAAAAYYARAYDMAPYLPSLARKFADYARSLNATPLIGHEESMRIRGDTSLIGVEQSELIRMIDTRMETEEEGMITPCDLGYDEVSPSEWERFVAYPWSWETRGPSVGYVESLPAAWRPAWARDW
jgi:hypothetical protein